MNPKKPEKRIIDKTVQGWNTYQKNIRSEKYNQGLNDMEAYYKARELSVDEVLYIIEHTPYENIEGFIKTCHSKGLRYMIAQAIVDAKKDRC